jgi:hypothetical protein
LSARDGRGNGLRLCLITVGRDVSAQGYDALLAILTYRNILETSLIERCANAGGNVG